MSSTAVIDGTTVEIPTGYELGFYALTTTPCPSWCIKSAGHVEQLHTSGAFRHPDSDTRECASRAHTAYLWRDGDAAEVAVEAYEYAYLDGTVEHRAAVLYTQVPSELSAVQAEMIATALSAAAAALSSATQPVEVTMA